MKAPLRLTTFLFTTVLTGGLLANLMFFQHASVGGNERAHRANNDLKLARATAGTAAVDLVGAKSEPESSAQPKQDVTTAAQAIEVARSVQVALKSKGYAPGPADGVPGLMTRAAMMAFEYDNGLYLSGDVNRKRLEMLVYGVPDNLKYKGGRATLEVGPIAQGVVRTVQGSLKTVGYDIGDVDGVLNMRTVKAITEFEADQGLNETGRISGELMAKLVSMASQGKLALQN